MIDYLSEALYCLHYYRRARRLIWMHFADEEADEKRLCYLSNVVWPWSHKISTQTLVTLENQACSLLKGTMSQRTGLQTNFECCVFHLLGDKSIRLSTRVFAVSPWQALEWFMGFSLKSQNFCATVSGLSAIDLLMYSELVNGATFLLFNYARSSDLLSVLFSLGFQVHWSDWLGSPRWHSTLPEQPRSSLG